MKHDDRESGSPAKPRSLSQKIRRGILLYVVVPYLSVTAIFTIFQRRLIYQPTVAESLRIDDVGLSADVGRDVELQTADGHTLRGWLFNARFQHAAPLGQAPLVIYFPGNSLNRHERIADLKEVASCGFDVLIFDYRGFGDSDGSPTESALTADAGLIRGYACNELGYDQQRIVIFGESIGGAVALSLWSDDQTTPPQPAALILSSTFASMPKAVAWHYPLFPFRYLLFDRWRSIDRIPRVTVPIVIFHGTEDDIVPVSQAQELAAAATGSQFIEIAGSGHNDIPLIQLRRELEGIAAGLSETPDSTRE